MSYLAPCFAMGAAMAICKDSIVIGWETVLGVAAVFLWLDRTVLGPMLFFFSLFLAVLYLSGLSWVRRIRLPGDISYGVYIWGFLVQQVVASRYAHRGPLFNLFLSLAITLVLGSLSWFLLEKRCIALGKRCATAVRGVRLVRLSGEA